MSDSLSIYTIYDHPKDFPDGFICRRFESTGVPVARVIACEVVGTGETLEQVRQCLPPGLVRLDRHPNDDPNIIETWL